MCIYHLTKPKILFITFHGGNTIYKKVECLNLLNPLIVRVWVGLNRKLWTKRMNTTLNNIIKEELQKLLVVGFIYPIQDNQWVCPLVIVQKKIGKWWICVDYKELNKATQKDHFPLPLIDQVLNTLAGKKLLSFLDIYRGYNQIQISPEDNDKPLLLAFGEPSHTNSFHLASVM